MAERQTNGSSYFDGPVFGFPRRRVIWSCTASRGPLLTRYFLLQTRWFAVYLHHLHASDEDRALHDHPWSFVTFLLSGGYWEHTPARPRDRVSSKLVDVVTCHWHRRFSILWRPAEYKHRLELARPTWTLVLRFARRRQWGFWTTDGWIDWVSYGKAWCD